MSIPAARPLRALLLLAAVAAAAAAAPGPSAACARPLTIAAFKEFTAFILEGAEAAGVPMGEVTWVKNADEAHQYLESGERDVVFMSYDDTLSITLGDGFNGTAIVYPVHGGMLSLCGSVDPAANKTTVGIDTTTGYARALRYYLSTSLSPEQYEALNWVKAGATNIRFQALLDGSLDATLLNPPFTILAEAQGLTCTPMADVLGPYQGVVAHVTRDFLADPANVACLQTLADASTAVVAGLRNDPTAGVAALTTFYNTTTETATAIYEALWQPNGLATGLCFNTSQLAGTEAIYAWDTKQEVPADRTWVQDIFC
ncbi:bacterial extracellular solute-binding 3 family [Chlorella sorokiniana]|uniref:Bacterial extracellular solute-binding 3 family n=1 Tax=Chlorella sorokiniana TaxID=3076 RepID=A0A2P6TWU2_CHLSO|nr:bacterial extracellular solute-binding 3 family [Chlorella sorokiniana]|eukprot:PRW58521.1 bacterial extracellular solute-binding 3 family [Chlorella sorokiniana]